MTRAHAEAGKNIKSVMEHKNMKKEKFYAGELGFLFFLEKCEKKYYDYT